MENVIIPNIKGGLGNQLFQIAAAKGHAIKHNANIALNYNLNHNKGQGFSHTKYRDNFYSKIPSTEVIPSAVYNDPFFHYSEIPYNGASIIDGYFQTKKYFVHCTEDIKNLFHFSEADKIGWSKLTSTTSIDTSNTLVVHMRHGDYKNYPDVHPILGTQYYQTAFDYFLNQNVKPTCVIICTDDWDSVTRSNLIGKVFTNRGVKVCITSGCTELQDLYIMSQCNNIIMSNSSFSWWGTFFGVEKNVTAPKVWFGRGGPQDYHDIYEPAWNII